MKNLEQISRRIARLSPAQQMLIEQFVEKLETVPDQSEITLDQAIDEFEREHPELLHLLAQ